MSYTPEFCRYCGAKMTIPVATGKVKYNSVSGKIDGREMYTKCSRVHGLYGLWLYLTSDNVALKHQFFYWWQA